MSIPISHVPGPAAGACRDLVAEVEAVLGKHLVAAWLHGGTTFRDRSAVPGDLDVVVVVADAAPDERDPMIWRDARGSR
ncbi:MAG: hypothetical protein ACRDYE_15980, partial [Acidimicrobiales bacterium]